MPSLRRLLSAAVAAPLAVAAVLSPRLARADTTTLENNGIPTRNPDPVHPLPYAFSFQDCEEDVTYTWGVTVDNTAEVLQVWAGPQGDDCTQTANIATETAVCWAVSPQFTTANTIQVTVHGRDIATHIADAAGTSSFVTYTAADESACHKQQVATAVPLTLYFNLFEGASISSSLSAATYQITVDTLGPPSPCISPGQGAGLQGGIGIGDSELIPNFLPPLSTDVYGMRLFCTPQPGKVGVAQSTLNFTVAPTAYGAGNMSCGINDDDAGGTAIDSGLITLADGAVVGARYGAAAVSRKPYTVLDEAGTDADSATTGVTDDDADVDASSDDSGIDASSSEQASAACGTSLTDGMNGSQIPSDYYCGDFGGQVSSATIQGLKNGTLYAFAVAGTDQVGNAGPITFLGCTTPEPIENFYNAYVEAGGNAGGGFCSTPPMRGEMASGAGASAALVSVGTVLAFSLVRRRRRRK